MEKTISDAIFDERFSSPLSFTLSDPPESQPATPSQSPLLHLSKSRIGGDSVIQTPTATLLQPTPVPSTPQKPVPRPIAIAPRTTKQRDVLSVQTATASLKVPTTAQKLSPHIISIHPKSPGVYERYHGPKTSLRPLIVHPSMNPLHGPFGNIAMRTRPYTHSTFRSYKRPLLEELLGRYGGDVKKYEGKPRSDIAKFILELESDMENNPGGAHMLVGRDVLTRKQPELMYYAYEYVEGGNPSSGGLRSPVGAAPQTFQETTEDATADATGEATAESPTIPTQPFIAYSHFQPSTQSSFLTWVPHSPFESNNIAPQQFVPNMIPQVSPTAPITPTPFTIGGLTNLYNSWGVTDQHLDLSVGNPFATNDMADIFRVATTSNANPGSASATSLAGNAFAELSEAFAPTDVPSVGVKDLQVPWGEGTSYLCCTCGYASTKEWGLAACQLCGHLICREECFEM